MSESGNAGDATGLLNPAGNSSPVTGSNDPTYPHRYGAQQTPHTVRQRHCWIICVSRAHCRALLICRSWHSHRRNGIKTSNLAVIKSSLYVTSLASLIVYPVKTHFYTQGDSEKILKRKNDGDICATEEYFYIKLSWFIQHFYARMPNFAPLRLSK